MNRTKTILRNLIIVFTILAFTIFILFLLIFKEARTGKEITILKSAGNCRIVNLNYSNENNLDFVLLKKKDKNNKDIFHVVSVNKENYIFDFSNGTEIKGTIDLNSYIKNNNATLLERYSWKENKYHFFNKDNFIEKISFWIYSKIFYLIIENQR